MKKVIFLNLLGLILAFGATPVMANSYTFDTDSSIVIGTGGQAVSSKAVFETGANSINITLTNTLSDLQDVAQALSDLAFYFASTPGATAIGTLTSSSGLERTVDKQGAYTNGSSVTTGWLLSSISGGLYLNVLGSQGVTPTHLIIGGPASNGVYASANGSIAGNPAHNPFLTGDVTFILSVPGVTASTVITDVVFSYGTTQYPLPPRRVPEPTTMLLLGLGLVGLAGFRRKMK